MGRTVIRTYSSGCLVAQHERMLESLTSCQPKNYNQSDNNSDYYDNNHENKEMLMIITIIVIVIIMIIIIGS